MPYFTKDSNLLTLSGRPGESLQQALKPSGLAYRTGTQSSGCLEASKVNLSVPEEGALSPYVPLPLLFSHTLLGLLRPGFSP